MPFAGPTAPVPSAELPCCFRKQQRRVGKSRCWLRLAWRGLAGGAAGRRMALLLQVMRDSPGRTAARCCGKLASMAGGIGPRASSLDLFLLGGDERGPRAEPPDLSVGIRRSSTCSACPTATAAAARLGAPHAAGHGHGGAVTFSCPGAAAKRSRSGGDHRFAAAAAALGRALSRLCSAPHVAVGRAAAAPTIGLQSPRGPAPII